MRDWTTGKEGGTCWTFLIQDRDDIREVNKTPTLTDGELCRGAELAGTRMSMRRPRSSYATASLIAPYTGACCLLFLAYSRPCCRYLPSLHSPKVHCGGGLHEPVRPAFGYAADIDKQAVTRLAVLLHMTRLDQPKSSSLLLCA